MGKKEKMVFEGEIYRIYQWKQKLYDGSYATFERAERPSVVQILCMMGNSVLLAKEEQPNMEPSINMFGGVIEEGERPLEAAKRELLEEVITRSKAGRRVIAYVTTEKGMKIIEHAKILQHALSASKSK